MPPLPQPKETFEQGGDAWAVYLAVVEGGFGTPAIAEAESLADGLGCDSGGAQAVGVPPEGPFAAVSIYFETVFEVAQVVVALEARGHSLVGMGLVQTFCLD